MNKAMDRDLTQQEKKNFNVHFSLLLIFSCIGVCVHLIVNHLFEFENTSIFKNKFIYYAWPPNSYVNDNIINKCFNMNEVFYFMSGNSTLSIFCLFSLIIILFRECNGSPGIASIQKVTSAFFVMGALSLWAAFTKFDENYTRLAFSCRSPMIFNLVKSWIFVFGFYMSLIFVLSPLLLKLVRKINRGKDRESE